MSVSTERPTLKAFIAGLDRAMSAQAMYEAALRAEYKTTLSSVYATRTVLGIAKARGKYERKTAPKPPVAGAEFTPPSDEAILAHLIVKMGFERASRVFERVMVSVDRLDLDGPAARSQVADSPPAAEE